MRRVCSNLIHFKVKIKDLYNSAFRVHFFPSLSVSAVFGSIQFLSTLYIVLILREYNIVLPFYIFPGFLDISCFKYHLKNSFCLLTFFSFERTPWQNVNKTCIRRSVYVLRPGGSCFIFNQNFVLSL